MPFLYEMLLGELTIVYMWRTKIVILILLIDLDYWKLS